ncbi:MAG: hypothetical protein F6K55_48025 [Moorea sp. SIO4A3]|nr:hypothetical protein [Moorena sp. SIO4A3]
MRYTGFVPCSLFPVPCSLFPIPCSLFPTQLQTPIFTSFFYQIIVYVN